MVPLLQGKMFYTKVKQMIHNIHIQILVVQTMVQLFYSVWAVMAIKKLLFTLTNQ